jgi:hypothetical protein
MKKIIFMLYLCSIMSVAGQEAAVRGRVLASVSREAVEGANVVLQTVDSAFVTGAVTDSSGRYIMQGIRAGRYRLMVSAIGYERKYVDLADITADVEVPEILMVESAVALSGVTVRASNLVSGTDRKLVYPSERQVQASSSGLDLLRQLMLPKLVIDPVNDEVKLPGGGELQYRINGVRTEVQDIIALRPSEIIRIEYHDNPGIRYGNAEVVLDYIVRRPQSGGSVGVNVRDALNAAWGNNHINGKVNHRASEFSFNYGISHRSTRELYRDNEETFLFADGSRLTRREVGLPDFVQFSWQNINASYSYVNDRRMLNISTRTFLRNEPHFNYHGILYNIAAPEDQVEMRDQSNNSVVRPALDVYYQENLKDDQTLVLNLVGTYISTGNHRIYQESRHNILLTDIDNTVTGRKYSYIGEGIYEKKLGSRRITGGMKHTQAYTDNIYGAVSPVTTKMTQSETVLYGELRGKKEKVDYTFSAGLMRSYVAQQGLDTKYDKTTLQARLILQYTLPGRSYIRLLAGTGNVMPSLADMSAVDQAVDSLQTRRGNPHLQPYYRYRSELTYEIQSGKFFGNLWSTYEYLPGAIMEEKYLESGRIIQTWNNQRNWQRAAGRLTLRYGPFFRDIFQASLSGGLNHYISNGNSYRHTYSNPFVNTYLSATLHNFTATAGIETAFDWFYGESLDGGEGIHYFQLGYKHKTLSVNLGLISPFISDHTILSDNRSMYASNRRALHVNMVPRMLTVQLVWNINLGRSFTEAQKRISNADDDAGVMNAGK